MGFKADLLAEAKAAKLRRDAAAASTEGQVHDLVLQMNNLHDPELLQMVFVEKDFLRVLLNWLKRAGRIRSSLMSCFYRLSPLVPVSMRKMLLGSPWFIIIWFGSFVALVPKVYIS